MASLKSDGKQLGAASELHVYYRALLLHFGAQHWWPARTRLEVILGTILTQNTTWRNTELAIRQLRKKGLLTLGRLRRTSEARLAICIRSAGFYRQKAQTIRSFLDWLARECQGSIPKLFAMPPEQVRNQLLSMKGFGPETADAILLYAGRYPFFVADAYTRRILARHHIIPATAGYSEAQNLLHQLLPRNYAFYNEYHALLVEAGKRFCKRTAPCCDACPLQPFLPDIQPPPGEPRREREQPEAPGSS
jgi:endonuclease-3 related protein